MRDEPASAVFPAGNGDRREPKKSETGLVQFLDPDLPPAHLVRAGAPADAVDLQPDEPLRVTLQLSLISQVGDQLVVDPDLDVCLLGQEQTRTKNFQ